MSETCRSAGLEGDASADGLGSLGAATGRWLTRGMLEAYACLGAALAEEQAAAERAAAHEQLAGGRARSLSLGRDRAGASYWAIGPRAPLSVWAPSRAALESLLPPFEPAPPPAPPAGLAIHEHAESLPGGLLAAEGC
ncbi:hypothetical protein EMIHUDRAFT_241833 [Emiliania huxleyi CCMP1516]|uniref:Uncharacterized protein n=2 Tax=Emiliania huxleyi TaxID=2903 RepID=A0A0D3JB78_EMIH1|nr:hypothetical protein EMIHUDRAFT_241833 [Emiliania huxleyi CCMP1516]EOD20763.1 hypothetical protein EMIHUDRAFT_241833 [Emiliania huxleyi CCMP1516]|eukprot:XP_005773192.1 hypothetical protein EMIHUDRAFT_241833 [Emiliania huxleyi CCMP1516]